MKTVVKQKNVEIDVSKCRVKFYYGVDHNTLGDNYSKCFVLFYANEYRIVSTKELTSTYSYGIGPSCCDIEDFLGLLIDRGAKVYQFETFKELSDWLNS